MLETKRLRLRELNMDDLDDLYEILSDPESMAHYPRPKTLSETKAWIERNIERYQQPGYGLMAVILKEENRFIGECGITMQSIDGEMKPEIGYHINKAYTRKGYATEAAVACRNFGFDALNLEAIYSYMKFTNLASAKVAEKNGMTLIKTYDDPVNIQVKVYEITKESYQMMTNS